MKKGVVKDKKKYWKERDGQEKLANPRIKRYAGRQKEE